MEKVGDDNKNAGHIQTHFMVLASQTQSFSISVAARNTFISKTDARGTVRTYK